MANVLVTGGAGFIGAHVSQALLREGHGVWVLDDLSGGFKENVPSKASFIKNSILDHRLLKDLFEKHSFQYVFHLAAYAAEGLSHFIKRFNYENNLIGSVNLINLSVLHKVKCFVFTSSIAVYGKNQVPMREDLVPQPEDPYGIAKYAVEQDLKVSHEMFGLNYIIFRPHNVYGEKQNIGDKYRNVVGIFMNQIMQGLPMTIFGDGTQKRAFSYIDDVAPIIARSINESKAYNQVFNIGADEPYTVNYLAKEIAKVFNVEPRITHLEQRNEVQEAYSDHEKVRVMLGAKPKVTLEMGLKKMSDWAKQHGARKSRDYKNIEISVKLPSSWKLA
ncbi:MAG: UDP-glucose 4-epimerase [Omnitrophica bacterium RIFCSPHIGHO2_02_FULL_46_11]|nr:MAG: UDP-glucose 4-epimerase [Omnitrophica bacterium RIFCSPHIGHO2_02_FULL_46_11]OGW87207.1 MAG: UDP-glucose 4-epimerase [Omnitrophica bacterium RIFCSPLOWO2_01_FULL_45_10b]